MVQDRFIPNIIHMDKFCHQKWKMIYAEQSVFKTIHRGPRTGSLPIDIKFLVIGASKRDWKEYKHVQRDQRSRM